MKKTIKFSLVIFLSLNISCGGGEGGDDIPTNNSPSSFTIQVTDIENNEATLSWTTSTDPDGDIVTYTIQQGTTKYENLTQTSKTIENLKRNTLYKGCRQNPFWWL